MKFTKVLTRGKKSWITGKVFFPGALLSMIKHQRWANLLNRQDTETKVICFLLIKPRKNSSCFVSLGKMLTKFLGENISQMPLWKNVGSFPLYTHFSKLELCTWPRLDPLQAGETKELQVVLHTSDWNTVASLWMYCAWLAEQVQGPQELCTCKVASVVPLWPCGL